MILIVSYVKRCTVVDILDFCFAKTNNLRWQEYGNILSNCLFIWFSSFREDYYVIFMIMLHIKWELLYLTVQKTSTMQFVNTIKLINILSAKLGAMKLIL